MLYFKKISLHKIPELVEISYKGDNDMCEKYHIEPYTFEQALNKTIDEIKEISKIRKMSYYKVIYKDKPIGYVAVFEQFLYSFSVNKNYRNKEVLSQLWQQIKSLLGKVFYCALPKRNTRAIAWICKNGMKFLFDDRENNTITFINE